MCEWLKKIFGFKCSCKHCHCGEEANMASHEGSPCANQESSVSPEGSSGATPSSEAVSEAPAATPENSINENAKNL